jgi:hypothetical protein
LSPPVVSRILWKVALAGDEELAQTQTEAAQEMAIFPSGM